MSVKKSRNESDAARLGRRGGQARAKSLTKKERKTIASNAAKARWGKVEECIPVSVAEPIAPEPSTPDFTLENHGSLCLLRPNTPAASQWLLRTAPEDAQFLGDAMAIEPRYVAGVIDAAQNDGLTVGQ